MVTQAEITDAEHIADLINSDSKHLLRRTREEVEAQIANFVVIKDKDKVVACGAFEEYAPKIAEIRSIIVDKHYRKRGYGDLIVRELLTRAKPKQEVFVVTSSVKFFNKIGFQDCLNEKRILFYQK